LETTWMSINRELMFFKKRFVCNLENHEVFK
jgi:hypothetical protein